MTRHPRDPAPAWQAIGVLAKLVAQGLLHQAEAAAALAAAPAAGADPSGWQARRAWRLADAVAAWRRERARVRRAIAPAAAPLLLRRAPRAALLAVAAEADPRGALLPAEREALLGALVARRLARKTLSPARGRGGKWEGG
jgi:hypothetical protein